MTFRLTPPVFRREVERRLLDVQGVMLLTGLANRQTVMKRVRAGTLPRPVLTRPRAYAMWDKDEIENHNPDTSKERS